MYDMLTVYVELSHPSRVVGVSKLFTVSSQHLQHACCFLSITMHLHLSSVIAMPAFVGRIGWVHKTISMYVLYVVVNMTADCARSALHWMAMFTWWRCGQNLCHV